MQASPVRETQLAWLLLRQTLHGLHGKTVHRLLTGNEYDSPSGSFCSGDAVLLSA